MRDGVGVSKRIGASLLLTLDLLRAPASLSCFIRSTKRLMSGLRRVMQDSRAITKEEKKD